MSEVADSTQYKPMLDDLLASVTSLSALPLAAIEKKQLDEAQKGVAILTKRLANGDMESDMAEKVGQIVDTMKNTDFLLHLYTGLVNSVWKELSQTRPLTATRLRARNGMIKKHPLLRDFQSSSFLALWPSKPEGDKPCTGFMT